jgi:hypothetical protein
MMPQDNIPTPIMRCDHTAFICLAQVARAPIIVIPSVTAFAPNHLPLRIPTPLHYCEHHAGSVSSTRRGGFDVQTYLSGAQKARIEHLARLLRPDDFRPDFEAAFADLVLVTTPEYRRLLVHIGATHVA